MDQSDLERSQSSTVARAAPRPLHNLPASLTPFVGRDDERAQLLARLREPASRLLTITGPGGVGKTRLALEAAPSLVPAARGESPFAHGVYLVSLTSDVASGHVLATTIANALGIALSGRETPGAQVIQYLREKALLLLLDNFEQALGGASFVTTLLQEAPALKILATSRERLNLRGERVLELAGLPFPNDPRSNVQTFERSNVQTFNAADLEKYDAIRLFVQTALAVEPDFALTEETAPAVVRICRLVEGLPLGIELAAAWTRVLSCDEIAQEIAQSLDFLTSTTQDLPTRQQSLRAVFDYSWNMLSEAERQALRQLSVFRGSFTREAANAVLSFEFKVLSSDQQHEKLKTQNSELLTLLASLVDKSLLRRVGVGNTARYEVLELLRQYAAEQLDRAGDAATTAARHTAYYASWMAARTNDLRGPGQQAALAAIGGEIEQIRAAWNWAATHADVGAIGQMADSLFHFYDMHSWFQEGAEAFGMASRALAVQQDEAGQIVYGKVHARHGWFTFHLGRQAEARNILEQSLALLRRLDARTEMIFALNYLGVVCSYLGTYDQTRALCQESLTIADAVGDQYGRAIACNILGQTAYDLGEYTEAKAWHQQSLLIEQQIGNRWSMTFSLTNLGNVAYVLGEYAEARWLFEQSLQTREETGDIRGVAICFNRLGDIAIAQGDAAEAGKRYAQSLALFREIGNQWGMAASLINLGRLAVGQERDAATCRLLQEALRLALATQSAPQVAQILTAFAPIALRRGEAAWAAELEACAALTAIDRVRPHAERLLAWSSPGPLTLDQAIAEAQRPPQATARGGQPQQPPQEPPAAAPTTSASYPAGLTAREVSVLRLVAQGMTDAQVAERLIVSPRTVSTHLTSIYGKLGVNSRSAATRFAVEHGLV